MNVFGSECTSGCESGWTLYLEQSNFASHGNTDKFADGKTGFCEQHFQYCDDEEEDLSMVSDASSGPPTFHEDEVCFIDVDRYQLQCPPSSKATTPQTADGSGKIRLKKKEKRSRRGKEQLLPSFLDDTASSPVISFSSKNNYSALNNNQASMESVLDYSQGYSATHFQGRSAFQDPFGFLLSSNSGKHIQNNQWL